jgi:hypothetical protein
MPETKAQRSAAARRGAETRRRHALEKKEHEGAHVVDRTTEFSDDVLKSLEAGQRAAIEAVRKFVDIVDEALPAIGDRPSRREQVIDAAMETPVPPRHAPAACSGVRPGHLVRESVRAIVLSGPGLAMLLVLLENGSRTASGSPGPGSLAVLAVGRHLGKLRRHGLRETRGREARRPRSPAPRWRSGRRFLPGRRS